MNKRTYYPWVTVLLFALVAACTPIRPEATLPPGGGTVPPPTVTPLPAPAAADEAADGDEYVDPQGLFSAPIPTGWTAMQEEGHVVLTSPNEGIHLYLLTVQAEDAATAVATGWQRVDPTFDEPVDQTLTPPAQGGIEEMTVINYEFDEENERVYQAVAQLYEDTYYLLLIAGDLTAIQQRQAQLIIISTGFTISALAETDLTGVEPLAVSSVITELETFIEEGLAQFGIPGAAVAIVQDGEVVYSNGFGVTEQGGDTPITPQTHMMIGSTGKSLTTMLMATLVDAEIMNWDTPVIEVLPQFAVADPELTQSITLRNLVCACTGVPRRDLELFFNADELSAEEIVRSLATFQFFTDFGEAFQYSNQLVATGGYAAAAAAGGEFGQLFDAYIDQLQAHVLDPIGMDNTSLSFAQVRERDQYALPHSLSLGATYDPLPLEFEEILLPVAPAGAHWSTLEDMTRYLLTELAVGVAPDGERVVSEENLLETWAPQVPFSADTDYGLGWFVSDYKGLLLIEHGGNTLGFTSSFGFLPDVGVGVIVLTNGQGANYFNESIRARLLELLFAQEPEAAVAMQFAYEQLQEQAERPAELRDAVDPAAVASYLGVYTNEALGELMLRLDGDVLLADVGEFAMPLLPLAEEDNPDELAGYMAMEPPLLGLLFELGENEAGEPVVEFGQGAVAYTFERVAE